MIEIIILAFALSMDAFAVSVGIGAQKHKNIATAAWRCGYYFGFFQGAMALIGYFGGHKLFNGAQPYFSWIATGLLLFIGIKMLIESRESHSSPNSRLTHQVMLTLAIATSIDALAAGVSLPLFSVSYVISCLIIAATSILVSVFGVYIGRKSGLLIGNKAEMLGGLILIAIAIKLIV